MFKSAADFERIRVEQRGLARGAHPQALPEVPIDDAWLQAFLVVVEEHVGAKQVDAWLKEAQSRRAPFLPPDARERHPDFPEWKRLKAEQTEAIPIIQALNRRIEIMQASARRAPGLLAKLHELKSEREALARRSHRRQERLAELRKNMKLGPQFRRVLPETGPRR